MLQPYLKSLAILDQEHFSQVRLIHILGNDFLEEPNEQVLWCTPVAFD